MTAAATCAVPGDAARVRQLADELRTMALGLREAVTLTGAASAPGWAGDAAAAFARLTHVDPEPYARAAAALGAASEAVLAHASVLAGAQRLAAEAAALSAAAPPGEDGRVHRERAERLLALARSRLRGSGRQTAVVLRQAAGAAPEQPGLLGRQLTALRAMGLELTTGVAQGVGSLALLAERFGPQRQAVDPGGYRDDVAVAAVAAARGTVDAVAHPVRTWDAVAASVQAHPVRALGAALPALAIGAFTGGTGAAALRGASLGARVTLRRTPGLPPGRASAVVRSVRQGNRSSIRRPDLQPYLGPAQPGGDRVRLSAVDHAVARVVLRDATASEPRITPRVRKVAQLLATDLLQPEHVLKGADSLTRKFATGLPVLGAGPDVVGRGLSDSVRYAVAVPDDLYAARTVQVIHGMRREGFRLAAAKVRWTGEGYRGTNLTFLDPHTGRLLELQVHTPASWSANLATHEDYEIARDPTRSKTERTAARARIAHQYDAVPSPPGTAELGARLKNPLDPLSPEAAQRSVRPPLRRLPEVQAGAATGGAAGAAVGAVTGSSGGGAAGPDTRSTGGAAAGDAPPSSDSSPGGRRTYAGR
jgi:hypothetical protein